MPALKNHPRVLQDPAIMVGKPCIAGTRIPVDLILRKLGAGMSIDDLLEGYPSLSREDVHAALRYAAAAVALETLSAAE